MHQSAKCANHQAGANQQHESQGHLDDYQNVSCAMLLAALAQRAPSFAEAGVQTRPGVLEDRNGAKQQAGKQGDGQREQ